VLADRVAQIFYVLNTETGKHIIVSRKQKIVGVDNVEDNDENINQFEESFAIYVKRCQRKICMIYLYEQLCIIFHINVDICVYRIKLKLFCLLSFV
jgi:hypothetical protein